jgi:hypothetical protein
MVRQYKPTPEERDKKVNTDKPAKELIRAVLRAGPHPKDEKPEKAKPKRKQR